VRRYVCIVEDRIVERWAVNDHLAMLPQFGAIADPTAIANRPRDP